MFVNSINEIEASATAALPRSRHAQEITCFHCGTHCRDSLFTKQEKTFCCGGCLTVFELLTENGLENFYALSDSVGVRIKPANQTDTFGYLDEPVVRQLLVDFTDERITRVTFRIPSIHCIACVWLLENLFRLQPGIGESQVNFLRKEIALTFENSKVKLSRVVELLTSLGYEPDLKLANLDARKKSPASRRLWLQIGIAGFAFGNIMLFSISSYLGLDSFSGPAFKKLFGYLSLLLATPVFFYSASDYWRSAWTSLRGKMLNIDVPIAAGIVALFAQSVYEVLSGRGEGYFDSLCGLLFFLLCGKLFQQKTYDQLAFDRDYKSFFPLSVTRRNPFDETEERVALAQLSVGDLLLIRNGELIPADARLVGGDAVIDYSFVTGESEPATKTPGDYLYAGGRQVGGTIELEIVKALSQSYLTSLWNQEAFRKGKGDSLKTLTNNYSQRFTKIIIAVAIGAAIFWWFKNPAISLKAFTSVLIVACPCALALAAPFTLGTAQRVLARRNIFLKSANVIEDLARVDSVVFDKTGTLTAVGAQSIRFDGEPLSEAEQIWIHSIAKQSTHPLSVRLAESLAQNSITPVRSFVEGAGRGIEGIVEENEVLLGSAAWLELRGVPIQTTPSYPQELHGSLVHVAIDKRYRGAFAVASAVRTNVEPLVRTLSARYELALLSGDNEKQRDTFAAMFGNRTQFNQSPLHKLEFIHARQRCGKTVMMVGDGLNDSGALQQSDVGVAVVENIGAFSPASDIIMDATLVPQLHEILRFSKRAVTIVRLSFLISTIYNLVGISIAARGLLSPVVCAILMPLSSATVVAFACGATTWIGKRTFSKSENQRRGIHNDRSASSRSTAPSTNLEVAA